MNAIVGGEPLPAQQLPVSVVERIVPARKKPIACRLAERVRKSVFVAHARRCYCHRCHHARTYVRTTGDNNAQVYFYLGDCHQANARQNGEVLNTTPHD